MKVSLNQKILSRNDQCARKNRDFFIGNGILCLNVISSPGSGKTTLLARTIKALQDRLTEGLSKATSAPTTTPSASARPAPRLSRSRLKGHAICPPSRSAGP